MDITTYDLKTVRDSRGDLTVIEGKKHIPFEIKRVYFIYNTMPGIKRGCHAHKSLEQILICVKGSCKVLLDDGKSSEVACLDNPQKGVFIGKMVWREMYDFSSDCVLLVLASDYYDENVYIRKYDDFIKAANKNKC
ncbi:MAG: WxcM-like domain-containing protein [Dehalococcoidia bacterium]|nr:WxcM-like domain-containing protein [Dehalococcoidia bacterium]